MPSPQPEYFDSLVATPSVNNEQSNRVFDEAYSSPRSSLNNAQAQNDINKLEESFVLPRVTFESVAADAKPLTQADRDKLVLEMMHEIANPRIPNNYDKSELAGDVEKATKAMKEGNFEELAKLIKTISKAGDDDYFGAFQKKLSKELGINVEIGGNGSFKVHYDDTTDPNASDKGHQVKTIEFDKDGKVSGATKNDYEGSGRLKKSEEMDSAEALKEMKQRLEELKKSKK
jgi:hypothetical protein